MPNRIWKYLNNDNEWINESMKTAQNPRPGEMVHGHQEMLHMLNAKNENLRKSWTEEGNIENVYINTM